MDLASPNGILRFQLSKANLSTAIGIQAIYLEPQPQNPKAEPHDVGDFLRLWPSHVDLLESPPLSIQPSSCLRHKSSWEQNTTNQQKSQDSQDILVNILNKHHLLQFLLRQCDPLQRHPAWKLGDSRPSVLTKKMPSKLSKKHQEALPHKGVNQGLCNFCLQPGTQVEGIAKSVTWWEHNETNENKNTHGQTSQWCWETMICSVACLNLLNLTCWHVFQGHPV